MADSSAPADQQQAANPAVETLAAEAGVAPSSGINTPGLMTGTVTPAMSELPSDQVQFSLKVSLADLCAKGTAHYAKKNYEEAAEVFARAAEMQAEINGEMDPENAEILFLYGRALFEVGKSKSDVLGGKAPEKKSAGAGAGKKSNAGPSGAAQEAEPESEPTEEQRIAEEKIAIVAANSTEGKKEAEAADAKKPFFQVTGDENFDDSEEEEAEGEAEGEEEEEEDDLAVAFEILDMSRVLYKKKLDIPDAEEANGKGKEKAEGDSLALKHIKERLADTHDLLAEISLENERYPNAITDFRESLGYKKQLTTDKASEILAEAHFKLSLALEFASVTTSEEDKEAGGAQQIDQGLRDEAATELEAAIESQKLKLQNKEVELATLHSVEENDITRKQIAECQDLINEMDQRLTELRKPPMDISAAMGLAGNAMGGILGQTLGESAEETQARLDEAKKSANDLSNLIRKKPKEASSAPSANGSETNGKRKAEDDAVGAEDSKKARVEDAAEA